MEWEKIFTNYMTDKRLYPKYINGSHNLVSTKNGIQSKNEEKT